MENDPLDMTCAAVHDESENRAGANLPRRMPKRLIATRARRLRRCESQLMSKLDIQHLVEQGRNRTWLKTARSSNALVGDLATGVDHVDPLRLTGISFLHLIVVGID